jgi:hypothetical protein
VDRLDSYAPLRQGMRLTYRLSTSRLSVTVTLRVSQSKLIAGTWTAVLDSQSSLGAAAAELPLGLGGTTIRLQSDSVVRTASGGAVRDLASPLQPGQSWRDRRAGVGIDATITEVRTVLGPQSLSVGAGRFQRCLAVGLDSTTQGISGTGTSGTGVLWYCPAVGLARAHLVAGDEPLDVELISVR